MVVSAAGKIDHDEFVDRISKACLNLPKGTTDNRIVANYIGGEYREEKDLEQIHLITCFKGIDLHHEDYYSLLVYSSLLGEGMSSKLFQENKRKKRPSIFYFFFCLSFYRYRSIWYLCRHR